MSSASRTFAQNPSRTIWNYGDTTYGAYMITEAALKEWTQTYNANVNGNMIGLNMNDSDFGDALYTLMNDNYYNGTAYTSVLDLGKKVFIGMTNAAPSEYAGESRMVTLNLIKVLTGYERGFIGYIITAVNINDDIKSQVSDYLDIFVGRGAA